MKDPLKLFVSIVICQAAGLVAAPFTITPVLTWYPTLVKPPLNPPGYVFGPVWTVLYFLMGISLYLIWKDAGENRKAGPAMNIFFLQLFLNFLWSFLFFVFRLPQLALIDIILLLAAIVITIKLFMPLSKTAAFLLVPYLLWVSFATYLNLAFVILNP